MKIHYSTEKVMFEFPRFQKRWNPYDEDGDYGDYPTFTGLIIRKNGYDELGFAATIDMDYKGKEDQVGDFLVMWHGSEEEFINKCNELQIDIQIYDWTKNN